MGKLIVLEGTDGSGKSTQFARLTGHLQTDGITFERVVFPQYDKPSSGTAADVSARRIWSASGRCKQLCRLHFLRSGPVCLVSPGLAAAL